MFGSSILSSSQEMKNMFYAALLFCVFVAFVDANEDDNNWPSYLKRCSPDDPNFNECLKIYANEALKYIVYGDDSIGIPSCMPYTYRNKTFGENTTFTLDFYQGATISGMKNLQVDAMTWDLDSKMISINFRYHSAMYIHGRCKASGSFNDKTINGVGPLSLILIGGEEGAILTYTMFYDVLNIRNGSYMETKQRNCTRQESLRLSYNNELISREQTQLNMAYMNAHSDEIYEELNDELCDNFCDIVDEVLNPVFFIFPMETILGS